MSANKMIKALLDKQIPAEYGVSEGIQFTRVAKLERSMAFASPKSGRDCLWLTVNYPCRKSYRVVTRDPEAVLKECCDILRRHFAELGEELAKEAANGHIGYDGDWI